MSDETLPAVPLTFEQKMKDRIRESIGELMSDDDLQKILDRSIEELLFKHREVKDGWQTKFKPPLMHELVLDHLQPKVTTAIREWIEENPDKVQEALDKALEEGIGEAFIKAFTAIFARAQMNFKEDIIREIAKRGDTF